MIVTSDKLSYCVRNQSCFLKTFFPFNKVTKKYGLELTQWLKHLPCKHKGKINLGIITYTKCHHQNSAIIPGKFCLWAPVPQPSFHAVTTRWVSWVPLLKAEILVSTTAKKCVSTVASNLIPHKHVYTQPKCTKVQLKSKSTPGSTCITMQLEDYSP